MAGQYEGMAIGVFELDSECACFVALDAAAKAADVKIQAVERNRLGAGACVKMLSLIHIYFRRLGSGNVFTEQDLCGVHPCTGRYIYILGKRRKPGTFRRDPPRKGCEERHPVYRAG